MKSRWLLLFTVGSFAALVALLVAFRRRRKKGMMMMGFGNREAWIWFNNEFPAFVRIHHRLEALRDKMFVRQVMPRHPADYIVYGLARVCIEDFEQALNLCGNGFGIGAMQILRGMYERHVTAAYLANHQDEVVDFVDYHHIQQRRAVNHLKEAYRGQPDILSRLVSEDDRRQIEEAFNALPKKFKDRCEVCHRPTMMSWTTHSTAALARMGGQDLDKLYYYQYFRPTEFTHSTFKSVAARVVDKPNGSFGFESEGQQRYISEALAGIHNLILNVFDLQNRHFQLGLDEELEQCQKDYFECWAPESLVNEGSP